MASLALPWVSVSPKRALMEPASSAMPSAVMPAPFNACSTLASVVVSTLTVDLLLEICTAGASPKKLGNVYSAAISSTTTIRTYFQAG